MAGKGCLVVVVVGMTVKWKDISSKSYLLFALMLMTWNLLVIMLHPYQNLPSNWSFFLGISWDLPADMSYLGREMQLGFVGRLRHILCTSLWKTYEVFYYLGIKLIWRAIFTVMVSEICHLVFFLFAKSMLACVCKPMHDSVWIANEIQSMQYISEI